MYQITARITKTDGVWTSSRDVPTFYLDENVQGITDANHAWRIAREIIDPLGTMTGSTYDGWLCVSAVKV